MTPINLNDILASLNNAGFVGRCRVRDIAAGGLLRDLYRCMDAGLARFDGAVNFGATGSVGYVFILAAA
jgi:hypothetical protein